MAHEIFELLEWKRAIFDLYAEVRADGDPERAWRRWRTERDRLFATHPQSPLPASERGSFTGLDYFDYDPAYRFVLEPEPAAREAYDIGGSAGSAYSVERFARVALVISGSTRRLELYWLTGYGGGLFVPFADATNGSETYGGGRYLVDTVKGADLGTTGGALVIDFNFAYNPSCSYDPRWACPLAPPPNRLDVEVRAGERT